MTEVRYELGSQAVAYLRSYLNSNAGRFGRRLGALLAERDLEAGSVWAFLPKEPSPRQRVNLESGGLYRELYPWLYGPTVPRRDFDESEVEPAYEWVNAVLAEESAWPRMFCVDNAVIRRSHISEDPRRPLLFCGEDVYEYALADDLGWETFHLACGARWQPNVGIVTDPPATLERDEWGHRIAPQAVEEMAASAIVIAVGAWDGEAHLFWEPR